jgi:uncharacterized membrane protein
MDCLEAIVNFCSYFFKGNMNTLTDLGFKAGPYLIILSMLVLGMQHFYFADPIMVGGFSVPLIPGRAVWAYLTGIVLIAGAVAVLMRKRSLVATTTAGAIIFVFTIFFFVPSVIENPASGFAWTLTLKGFSLCGSILLLAAISGETGSGNGWYLNLAAAFIGVTMVVFGIEHFIYIDFTAELVLKWIPGRRFWAYFCGVALFGAGTSILIRKQAVLGATLLGIMILTWVIVLHIPRSIELDKTSEWTNTFNALTMSGGAFLLAGLFKKQFIHESVKVKHEAKAAFK